MRNRRLFAATALLTTALGLSLSACGPDTPSTTSPNANAGAPSTAASTAPSTAPSTAANAPAPVATVPTPPASAAPAAATSAKPTPAKTTAKPTPTKPTAAPSSPTADCTAAATHPGHKVINAVTGWADPNRLGGNPTKFICGPDVPDDGYYQSVAGSADYTFAPGATAHLVGNYASEGGQSVSITDLLTHIDHCTTGNTTGNPSACYGNMYDITVDSAGRITTITEVYHP
ncbi:hypothetical protein OG455_29720 [Kitasatospora sp. NBC_01287]|uniref:hypothetical protein n=1 Tax=Kitasatospora sp. NBC_01287 TaxID=2903573 RepID=UPI0022579D19|nr:hypothetical protein [Kitasatospora sp. NBC_01287]MCX4749643.1 hypothetical protein [Kitasatospora sp. NBC_01287]